MSFRRCFFALTAVVGLLGACSGRDDATGPNDDPAVALPQNQIVLSADGPQNVTGEPGETLADFPRARVTVAGTGAPVAGASVRFSRRLGGLSRTVVTDAQGIAHFGQFTFGTEPGVDEVLAVAYLSSLPFKSYATSTEHVVYDLRFIGGRPLPQDFPGSKTVGGHYLLMTDGTYYRYYDVDVDRGTIPPRPTGRYVKSRNTIDFYLEGAFGGFFYQDWKGHFSTGTLEGGVMQVVYVDYIDFENEVYVRR